LCKQASYQLNSEAATSCGLSVPAEDATIDVEDFQSSMNVPVVDARSNAEADQTRHLGDRAETSQTINAELLLLAEFRTGTLASTTKSQRQSFCAPFPYNKIKQEECDWINLQTGHEDVVGYQGKKEPWFPDSSVVVNLLMDIHCNKNCPQNWNILLPSIDGPDVWVSNGKAFNKKATGRRMYQLIGQLAVHLHSLEDKLPEGMVTDVLGDIEGDWDYCRQLEDIANAESCEGNEPEFNALSMRIKDVLYKHFLLIEGHKLIEGH